MALKPEQLQNQLQRKLAPVYLVGGSEALLVDECAAEIRATARQHGYAERQVLEVERGFDWGLLEAEAGSLSLFASRRLIDLRLPGGKPGIEGARAIGTWVQAAPADTLLLITAFDAEARDLNKAKWVKVVDQAGAYVPVYPIEPAQLPRWIEQRMQRRGLKASEGAVALLAERVQGNLLAAQQEIDKLALLAGGKLVDENTILDAVADNARFQAFGMIDAALAGDTQQALRALRGLRSEGVELVQIMGALLWQLRQLAGFSFAARNQNLASVLQKSRLWPKKRALLEQALRRYELRHWHDLLLWSGRIDRQVKGRAAGDPWQETERLLLALAA